MAAIGKGFAIGSAALVSLALFGAFCVRADITGVDILHPWVFTGLLFGAMMSYAFAALTTSLSLRRTARARRPVTATPQQWRHLANLPAVYALDAWNAVRLSL